MTPSLESFTHPVRLCMGVEDSLLSIPSTPSGRNPGSDHWWRLFLFWILRTQSQSSLPQGRCPAVWNQLTPRRAFHQDSWQDQPREVPGWGHCSWLILKTHRKLWLLQQTQREKVEGRGKKETELENFLPTEHLTASGPWLPESPRSAMVNRLFSQNRLQKLIDSYQLIECGVSSFILLIRSNALHLPDGSGSLLL